jgi:hypothetical protein
MSQAQITLLDCEYFPCIAWYRAFLQAPNPSLEFFEYFERTSFRNRCEVAGPNGKITLSIPLEKGRNQRTVMKDVRVCNKEKWQLLHFKTLSASYRRTPFFEYYEDELNSLFEKQYHFLIDINLDSLQLLNKLLKVDHAYALTERYEKTPDNTQDLRRSFYPKSEVSNSLPVYIQNFEERHGFTSNLSMLDLLFSCGHRGVELFTSAP